MKTTQSTVTLRRFSFCVKYDDAEADRLAGSQRKANLFYVISSLPRSPLGYGNKNSFIASLTVLNVPKTGTFCHLSSSRREVGWYAWEKYVKKRTNQRTSAGTLPLACSPSAFWQIPRVRLAKQEAFLCPVLPFIVATSLRYYYWWFFRWSYWCQDSVGEQSAYS